MLIKKCYPKIVTNLPQYHSFYNGSHINASDIETAAPCSAV